MRKFYTKMISVALCITLGLTLAGGIAFAQESGSSDLEPAEPTTEITAVEALQARIAVLPLPEETTGMDDSALDGLRAEVDAISEAIAVLDEGAETLDTAKFDALVQMFAPAPMLAAAPAQVEASGYEEWTSADSLPTSGKYKLMNPVTLPGKVTVGSWAISRPETPSDTLVLDLNGYTVTAAGGEAFFVQTAGGLTIEDSAGGGKITNAGISGSSKMLIQVNGGAFELKGGTVENATSSGDALYANSGSIAVISGGNVVNSGSSGSALYVNGSSTVALAGGTVENVAQGANAVYVNGGSFSMESGAVKTNTTYSSKAAIYANNSAASIEISGGNIESATVGVYAAFTPVTVTGGTITADAQAFQTRYATIPEDSTVMVKSGGAVFYTFSGSDNKVSGGDFDAPAIVKEYSSEQPGTATIFGGTYTVSPMDYVDEGSVAASYTEAGQDGVFIVGTSEQIADKVKSAPAGSKVEVLQGDVDLLITADGVSVTNSGNGTVTVNDKKVTGDPVVTHTHHAVKVEAKAATATENGNIAYWYCADCGKYFKDEALTQEIEFADTVIPAIGKPVYLADKATGVTLYAEAGMLPDGTQMVVNAIMESHQDYAAAKDILKNKADKFVLYDITLIGADGNPVQPNGAVTVGIPVPDGYDTAALAVHRINDDKTTSEYGVRTQDGMAYIATEHFSKYALIEKGSMNETGGQTAETIKTDSRPKTGDTTDMTPYILLLAAAAAAIAVGSVVAVRHKKQENK